VDLCLSAGGDGCALCGGGEPCLIGETAETTVWDWLVQVNREGRVGFAGKSDWRLPEVGRVTGLPLPGSPGDPELESLRTPSCTGSPCVPRAFDSACSPGCALPVCSCTGEGLYFSANTSFVVGVYTFVETVSFSDSRPEVFVPIVLPAAGHVRAVRGGD
jgi:hypothetical protein